MASNKVKLLGGALALFVSQAAMAVGLGDIKLKSALNEPLEAEIELLNVGDLSDLEMLVGLASRKDFDRAGVTREFFLTGLQFTVDLSGAKPRVLVKSEKPIREPYLDFLVEMQWPSGRLLKGYTLLVDLPIYTEKEPKAKTVDSVSSAPKPAPKTSQPQSRPSAPAEESSVAPEAGEEYQVQSGDTLWAIAKRSRPQGASIHQTMVTIHELNPRAFVGGDINMLKRGEVLRLPANHQITASHKQAVDEFVAQQSTGALIDAVDSVEGTQQEQTAEPEGMLKLSAAVDEQAPVESDDYSLTESEGAQQDGTGVATRELLENELTIAQEELARKDRALAEANQRIAMLEAQQESNQLIELQSDEASAAQVMASEANEQTQQSSESVEENVAEQEVSAANESKPAQPETVASSEEPAQDFWGQYKYYLMGGSGVLLLILLLLGLRRKSDENENADDFVFDEDIEPVFSKPEITVAEPEPEEAAAAPIEEPEEVDLEEDDQLFAAEAFDMDEPEQEVVEETTEAESVTQEEDSEETEMLPTLEADDAEEDSVQEVADDLDFDIDLELDDELEAEAVVDDADSAEEALELDDMEVVADAESEEADGDFDLDIDGDEIATKLDLAKAYSDVGDKDGAREMLEEVVEEGTDEQQQEAKKLLESLSE